MNNTIVLYNKAEVQNRLKVFLGIIKFICGRVCAAYGKQEIEKGKNY